MHTLGNPVNAFSEHRPSRTLRLDVAAISTWKFHAYHPKRQSKELIPIFRIRPYHKLLGHSLSNRHQTSPVSQSKCLQKPNNNQQPPQALDGQVARTHNVSVKSLDVLWKILLISISLANNHHQLQLWGKKCTPLEIQCMPSQNTVQIRRWNWMWQPFLL